MTDLLDEGQIHLLSLLNAGCTTRDISIHLRVFPGVIRREIRVVLSELGVETPQQAIDWATKHNLLTPAGQLGLDPMWKVDEVAAELGLSKFSVHSLIDRGEIAALWCGVALRVPEGEVDDYQRRLRHGDAWAPRPRTVLIGPDRARTATELRDRYQVGATIRDLTTATGYSHTFVRRLLIEAGVPLRERSGNTRQ